MPMLEGPADRGCPDEASVLIEVFVAGFQSAKTRSNYQANLRGWFRWADAGGIDGVAAQRADVEAYTRHLEEAGYAPNTICQRIATLASFYRWAVAEGQVAGNPVEGARRPRKAHGVEGERAEPPRAHRLA